MRVGRIAGFELRIHWSTLLIFGLLVSSLAAEQLPADAPGATGARYLVAALVAGLAFYAGLLAHEVSHALVARREGIEVEVVGLNEASTTIMDKLAVHNDPGALEKIFGH